MAPFSGRIMGRPAVLEPTSAPVSAAPPARVIELGSAPGRLLLRWRELFGYDVFGVDTSHSGLALQRDLFARYGLDESHSIHADFLDPAFQSRHARAYDIVSSAGLIEHFSDPRGAVRAHAALLRPGGLLVVSIPNFAGVYRYLVKPAYVAMHNVEIMQLARFRALFDFPDLNMCFCGYYGGVNLGLAYDRDSRFTRLLLRVQLIANLLMGAIPVRETRWLSPYLLFIGRKARRIGRQPGSPAVGLRHR